MSFSSESIEKLNRITIAWETFAPNSSFGGMTLPEFRDAIAPSFAARDRIAHLEAELAVAQKARAKSDHKSMNKAQLVINSVISDPEHGPDSDLYEAMGYTRRRRRYAACCHRSSDA
ncbi:MAG: hypothetical protein AAFY11_08980 [Cyanobacteria bacterium J06641_5]